MKTIFILLSILAACYLIANQIWIRTSDEDYSGNKTKRNPLPFLKTVYMLFPFFILASVILSFIVKIGGQEVGVVVTPSGVSDNELHTGWHIIPFWNDVKKMDRTVWVYTFTDAGDDNEQNKSDAIWTPTKDGIKMGLDLSVSWHIDPEYASWIYQNVAGNEGEASGKYIWIEDNIIRAKTKSALALTVSNFTPIEVYSGKRQDIQDQVFKRLKEEMQFYHLVLDQVDIREVFYNKEYEQAINNKKLAEQEVMRLIEVTRQQEEKLKQAEINKNIAIELAEGEAKALQIKGSSIAQNPKIIELEWINKWDGALPHYMTGDGQGIILNMK